MRYGTLEEFSFDLRKGNIIATGGSSRIRMNILDKIIYETRRNRLVNLYIKIPVM